MPLACNETMTMRHDVLRATFPGLPSDLRGSPYFASEEELIAAGLGPCLKKCLTVTGGRCRVDLSVYWKLFLGKSPTFFDDQGCKTAAHPVEKVQIKFSKSYFIGHMQSAKCCMLNKTASLEATNSKKVYDQCKRFHVSIRVN